MAAKEILLLQQQILDLNNHSFDLEAWKSQTIIFLERIFGKNNAKINMLRDLHYDYSSWSLRDTAAAGAERDKDPIKLKAKEILSAAIQELEILGLPADNAEEKGRAWQLLIDELTGKEVKEIQSIISSDNDDKKDKISEILYGIGTENLANILSKLIVE